MRRVDQETVDASAQNLSGDGSSWLWVLNAAAGCGDVQATGEGGRILDVREIWDDAPHSAFTDLIRYGDSWLCVFREGRDHVSPDGAIRVIRSTDGRRWLSSARIHCDGADLRDPKIIFAPDGRLMIVAAAARDRGPHGQARQQSMAWFSRDASSWDDGHEIGPRDWWLWRVTWHQGTAFAVGYETAAPRPSVRLFRSPDGLHYETLVDRLYQDGFPNESVLVFLADETCLCLLRRDAGTKTGLLGIALPP